MESLSELLQLLGSLEYHGSRSIFLVPNEGMAFLEISFPTVIPVKFSVLKASSNHLKTNYLILENPLTHSLKCSNTSCCQSFKTDEVRTKCFSSRLISGVGNFSYTVSLSAIRINLKNMHHYLITPYDFSFVLLEIIVYSALYSVGLKSKVNISAVSIVHVVLVQYIVQTLVEILQVE